VVEALVVLFHPLQLVPLGLIQSSVQLLPQEVVMEPQVLGKMVDLGEEQDTKILLL
jgi:hypothetical protein